MNNKLLAVIIFTLPFNVMAAALLPGDTENGKKLHDSSSCLGCHKQMTGGKPDTLYTRADRRVTNLGGLIAQVGNCNKMQKVGLDEDGVNDVVKYLNESFYQFGD
ncbi:MAG: cytochrome c [Arenicellales bacterium]